MNVRYKEVEDFYNFLYKDPKLIIFEPDHIISRNSGQYANDGLIYYTDDIARMMRTQAFRRMSKIFQLGTKFFENSNLKHSRAAHSKGTYARTIELCMHLLDNKNIKTMVEKSHSEKYIIAELMRALLHDIGHGPFSHTMETICNLPKGFHEDIGKRIINENKELNQALNRIYPNLPKLMEEVDKRNFLGLNRLFEGQFDVDRGDFLSRDSWAFGLKDNNSDDITYLFQNITIQKIVADGKAKLIPVFSYECLSKIEKFLDARFNNYQRYYYSPSGKLFDYIYKEFAEDLLSSKEEYRLKSFLKHNYNKRPEEIDLDEYLQYNDIEFLKGVLEVYDNTNNTDLKKLARICIPDDESYYALYYGLMVTNEDLNEEGNITLSSKDKEFFHRISSFPAGSTLELVKQRYILQKANNEKDLKYKLNEIKKAIGSNEEFNFKDYGIIYDVSKNNLYKNTPGEEIYISDEGGKVYTFDTHPKLTIPLKKFTNSIIIIDKEKLGNKVKNEKQIDQIIDIVKNRRKNTR